jgi:hypothetical protein
MRPRTIAARKRDLNVEAASTASQMLTHGGRRFGKTGSGELVAVHAPDRRDDEREGDRAEEGKDQW